MEKHTLVLMRVKKLFEICKSSVVSIGRRAAARSMTEWASPPRHPLYTGRGTIARVFHVFPPPRALGVVLKLGRITLRSTYHILFEVELCQPGEARSQYQIKSQTFPVSILSLPECSLAVYMLYITYAE